MTHPMTHPSSPQTAPTVTDPERNTAGHDTYDTNIRGPHRTAPMTHDRSSPVDPPYAGVHQQLKGLVSLTVRDPYWETRINEAQTPEDFLNELHSYALVSIRHGNSPEHRTAMRLAVAEAIIRTLPQL